MLKMILRFVRGKGADCYHVLKPNIFIPFLLPSTPTLLARQMFLL